MVHISPLLLSVSILVLIGLLAYFGVFGQKGKAVVLQNSRLTFRLGIIAVLGLLSYFGFLGNKNKTDSASTQTPSTFTSDKAAAKSLLSSDDQRMRDKLDPIIKCLNGELTHYEDSAQSYHQREQHLQSGETSPFDLPFSLSGLFSSFGDDKGSGNTECADQLQKGASLPPAISDLDADANTNAAQLRKIIGPGLEYETYVSQKKYLDDKFAHGRQLDATISPLLTSINITTEKIRAEVERQNSVIRRHELEAIEKKYGRNLLWHAHNSMIAARTLDEQLLQMRRNNTLTSAGVQAAIQPLAQAVDDANAYLQAHPDAKTTPANGQRPLWFDVETQLNTELADTRELRQKLDETPQVYETKTPFPETAQTHQENIRTQVGRVNDDFKSLIQAYNQSIQYSS